MFNIWVYCLGVLLYDTNKEAISYKKRKKKRKKKGIRNDVFFPNGPPHQNVTSECILFWQWISCLANIQYFFFKVYTAELSSFKECRKQCGACYNFSLLPVAFCSDHSAVPWWMSCVCLWSANAVSNRSLSHPSSLRQKRSLTCTRLTTGDSQERKPWHERWAYPEHTPQ